MFFYRKLHSTCINPITGDFSQKDPSPCGFSASAYHCEASSASAKEYMQLHHNRWVCASNTTWNGPNNGITGNIYQHNFCKFILLTKILFKY